MTDPAEGPAIAVLALMVARYGAFDATPQDVAAARGLHLRLSIGQGLCRAELVMPEPEGRA